jgi:hypothetical protein
MLFLGDSLNMRHPITGGFSHCQLTDLLKSRAIFPRHQL